MNDAVHHSGNDLTLCGDDHKIIYKMNISAIR